MTKLLASIFFVGCFFITHIYSENTAILSTGIGYRSALSNLGDELEPGPGVHLDGVLPYYQQTNLIAAVDLHIHQAPHFSRDILLGKAGLGLEYQKLNTMHSILPRAGLGLSVFWARTISAPEGQMFLLDDNEWEFGFFPFMQWEIPLTPSFSMGIFAETDFIFSEPVWTILPALYITGKYKFSISQLPW